MTLVAAQEREAILKRTKEALAVARSLGIRFGNPKAPALRLTRAVRRSERPLRGMPSDMRGTSPVADTQSSGASSLRAIAGELNAPGMLTAVAAAGTSARRLGLRRLGGQVPG